MDQTDYRILNLLQQDCRTTLKNIGDQVGLTAPAVSERVRRMEEQGVIRGYRAEVSREALHCGISGFVLVALPPEKYDAFCEFCRENPAIISHYHVIGVFNTLLRFAVRGTRELDELLSSVKHYGDSQTSIELRTYFETKELPVQGTDE